jgi:propane monooxygenase large subunit
MPMSRQSVAKAHQKIQELSWEPQYHQPVSHYGTDYTFRKAQKKDPLKQVLRSYFPMQEEKDHRVYGAQDGAIRGNMFRQVQERLRSAPRGRCRCCSAPCRTPSCTMARRSR